MTFRDYTKYEVLEDGRIWSYSHKKWLPPMTRKDGYQQVCLVDNEGKRKMYMVHRVVYESVTGEPIPEGLQVNHIDECKTNNHINNLNLMTHKENVNWGTGIQRCSKARINNPKRSKQVGAFKDGELVMTFPSIEECGRQGFCRSSVSSCCRNCYLIEGNNIFKGFEWRYI